MLPTNREFFYLDNDVTWKGPLSPKEITLFYWSLKLSRSVAVGEYKEGFMENVSSLEKRVELHGDLDPFHVVDDGELEDSREYPLIHGRTTEEDSLHGDSLHHYILLMRTRYFKLRFSRADVPFPFVFSTPQKCDFCSLTFVKPCFLIDHCFSEGHFNMLSQHSRGLSFKDLTILIQWIRNIEMYKKNMKMKRKKRKLLATLDEQSTSLQPLSQLTPSAATVQFAALTNRYL